MLPQLSIVSIVSRDIDPSRGFSMKVGIRGFLISITFIFKSAAAMYCENVRNKEEISQKLRPHFILYCLKSSASG